jgi:agmatinase
MKLAFLESEIGKLFREESYFHIISAPFERTVTYGGGTRNAPSAIIEASQQLEIYDGYSIPSEMGIFTLDEIEVDPNPEPVLEKIEAEIDHTLSHNAVPILIGGEHTVSLGAFRSLRKLKEEVGIIQFDAHADLRDSYQKSKLSHACVMRRAFDLQIPFFQIGTRSYSPEENQFRVANSIKYFDACSDYSQFTISKKLPGSVYLTIDIDVFDSSVMPATGTPEPGGLTWFQFFSIIEKIIKNHVIIGFDLVEFAPIDNFHSYDFFCARLIYNLMGIIQRNQK